MEKVCAQYGISTDTWSILAQPVLQHAFGSAVFCSGRIFLLGGHTYDTDIEEYDIKKDQWHMSAFKLPVGLQCLTALCVPL